MKYKFLGTEGGPQRIKFMGIYNFEKGQVTEVTDPEVLAKLKTHKFFELVGPKVKADVKDAEIVVMPIPDEGRIVHDGSEMSVEEAPEVKYHDMVKAIAKAGKKPKSRSKADVTAAYEAL